MLSPGLLGLPLIFVHLCLIWHRRTLGSFRLGALRLLWTCFLALKEEWLARGKGISCPLHREERMKAGRGS